MPKKKNNNKVYTNKKHNKAPTCCLLGDDVFCLRQAGRYGYSLLLAVNICFPVNNQQLGLPGDCLDSGDDLWVLLLLHIDSVDFDDPILNSQTSAAGWGVIIYQPDVLSRLISLSMKVETVTLDTKDYNNGIYLNTSETGDDCSTRSSHGYIFNS